MSAHIPDLPAPRRASLAWLNATQFLGAMNDNIFRFLIMFLLISRHPGAKEAVAFQVGAVFAIPFILFAPLGGYLADRFRKSSITVAIKIAEVGIMTFGVFSFFAGSEIGLYLTMFAMSTQSALFGPSKYGILPELAGRSGLSRANSLIEAFTNLAIIAGTALAPAISDLLGKAYHRASVACILVAALGVAAAVRIGATPVPARPRPFSQFLFRDQFLAVKFILRDGDLMLAILGSAWFTYLGGFIQLNTLIYATDAMGLSETAGGYLFLVGALGIAAGSLVAGKVSGRGIDMGLVPVGSALMCLGLVGLWILPPVAGAILPAIVVLGFGAGLFSVPLGAFIQFRTPRAWLGKVLGVNSLLSWIGVAMAAVTVPLLGTALGLDPGQRFLVMAALTLGLSLVALRVLPDFTARFLASVLLRAVYRIRTFGLDHLPVEGGALLVPNHVSMADAPLLSVVQPRRIRFLMDRARFEEVPPPLRFLLRLYRVIPVAIEDTPKQLLASLRQARAQIDDGFLVAIFAEGQLSHTGFVGPFHAGLETIVRKTEHPIIPVYLGGLWGSIFSHRDGPAGWRRPGQIPYPVSVSLGPPLPPATPADQVREAVLDLEAERYAEAALAAPDLAAALLQSCRRHGRAVAWHAADHSRLTYADLAAAVRTRRPPRGGPWIQTRWETLVQSLDETVQPLDKTVQSLDGRPPASAAVLAASEALGQVCRLGEGRTVVLEAALGSRAARVAGLWAPLLAGATVAEPSQWVAPFLTVTDRPGANGRVLRVDGSAVCPPAEADDGETRMGLVDDAWGGVATLNVPSLTLGRRHQDGRRPGSYGLPLPGLRARIVEEGEVQPAGRPGRLEFRGAQIAGDPGHWVDAGIRAYRDEAGFLYPAEEGS